MKIQFKYALLSVIALCIFFNMALAQEKGYTALKEPDLGYSIAFPEIWTREPIPDNLAPMTRLWVTHNIDYEDYISVMLQAIKLPESPNTSKRAVDFWLQHAELFTANAVNPKIIKNQRIRWADREAVLLQFESADLRTSVVFMTLVDGIAYSFTSQCFTKYYPQHKLIIEKIAASFSLLPTKGSVITKQNKVLQKRN